MQQMSPADKQWEQTLCKGLIYPLQTSCSQQKNIEHFCVGRLGRDKTWISWFHWDSRMQIIGEVSRGGHLVTTYCILYADLKGTICFFPPVVAMINSRVYTNVSLNRQHTYRYMLVLCSHLHGTWNRNMVVGPLLHAFWILEGSFEFVLTFVTSPVSSEEVRYPRWTCSRGISPPHQKEGAGGISGICSICLGFVIQYDAGVCQGPTRGAVEGSSEF